MEIGGKNVLSALQTQQTFAYSIVKKANEQQRQMAASLLDPISKVQALSKDPDSRIGQNIDIRV